MEDFTPRRAAEGSEQTNTLLSEWQESQQKLVFAAGKPGQDIPKGPGKDAADRLDAELRQFAQSNLNNPSDGMLAFQKAVNKFEDAADKKQAAYEFGSTASKIRVNMEKEAAQTCKDIEAEAARVPGRKELDADYSAKVGKFFDQVSKLPTKENERVLKLMEVKPGESLEERDQRVRDGIKGRPALLSSFNNMEDAQAKVEQSKSPRERELDASHRRDIEEYRTLKVIFNKVAARSQINA